MVTFKKALKKYRAINKFAERKARLGYYYFTLQPIKNDVEATLVELIDDSGSNFIKVRNK